MSKKNKQLLCLAILAGGLIMVYSGREMTGGELLAELTQIKLSWLGVAIACMLLHWGIEGKIVQTLLQRQTTTFSFKNAIRLPLIEHLFNAITPFSTGGQPAQLVALVKSGVDPGVGASVSLMKFVVYQVMIVLNFIACLLFGFNLIRGEFKYFSYLVLLGFAVNTIVVISLLMLMYCYPLTNWLVTKAMAVVKRVTTQAKGEQIERQILAKLANFHAESQYMRKEKQVMRQAFSLTFLQLVCYYVVPYFILLSLGVREVNVLEIVVLHAFIILIISLFPLPGGTGGAEYSFTLLFGSLIMTKKLVVAMLLWRLVTHYLGIVLGIVALLVKPDQAETRPVAQLSSKLTGE